MKFNLQTQFTPKGDQKNAIEKLSNDLDKKEKNQVLYGVTGSGKTFTIASVIERVQKPTLVISHNKTLAWQLYQEFKYFFPNNSIHYFVSYYDYYQPEAYIPTTDTYIQKDAQINEKIDAMRHAAVQGVLSHRDTIIVASVSCIYSLGSPESYQQVSWTISKNTKITRKEILKHLVSLGFSRNDLDPRNGMFRSKGEKIDIFPASGENKISIILNNNAIEEILVDDKHQHTIKIFPANFWITPEDKLKIAISNIQDELNIRIKYLKKIGQDIQAYRIEQKTNYDLEMMQQLGYCNGIENYSSHLEFREKGKSPFTLIDYMQQDFLTVIDESHITIPQIRGMFNGDRARKQTLIEHGFRLPSALDNRPLQFEEFNKKISQTIFVSATPGKYELLETPKNKVVEQFIRPTGVVEPKIEVRNTEKQMQDVVKELHKIKKQGERALVVTITKRLAEDIAEHLQEEGIKVSYIHSEIDTLTRPVLMNKLRKGEFDVLVGVNLLREGLDMPEVSLVIIFDADKEGFLRNKTTLLQTIGRAARHNKGKAIMYADKMTQSMKDTIDETNKRRIKQEEYNKKNNIIPTSIQKNIYEEYDNEDEEIKTPITKAIYKELEREMKQAAKNLDFEKAASLRDEMEKYILE